MKKVIARSAFYIGLFALWEVLARAGLWERYLFPAPSDIIKTLVWGFRTQNYHFGVLMSLKRIVIGYGLSILFGVTLGFLLSQNKWVEVTLGSLVVALQTLPSICWLPAALLWFGLSDWAIIFVVLLGSFLSITVATDDGIKNISPIYARAARTMGATGFRLYKDVIFPAAFPAILTGLKQGWSFAWRSLLAGELLFVSMGLGRILQMGRELNDISQVFAVMLLIILIGLAVDRLIFARLEARVRERWGLRK